MTDETVEHVVVEHAGGEHEDEQQAGATETVVAAETAVALAGATAAAAELDAAERMRRLEVESEEWREGLKAEFQATLNGVENSLRDLREVELQRHETERLALAESFLAMSQRQEAMEAQFQSLTRPESGTGTGTVEETEQSPTLGTAAEVEAGPVSLGASLGAEVENENSPSRSAHPIRRRRWI
jgi:hypothetical protein